MHFHIIIPVHNRVTKTLGVLKCLSDQNYKLFKVYLIDDGSTDGTSDQVVSQYGDIIDIKVLKGDGNLWWGGSIRLGIEQALLFASGDDVIVLMNDDIIFDKDLLSNAYRIAVNHKDTVFGPLVVSDHDMETIHGCGQVVKSWPLALTYWPYFGCKASSIQNCPELLDVDYLPGYTVFLPCDTVKTIGNINAERLPHHFADIEYTYRAKRAGFHVCICRLLIVYNSCEATGPFGDFGAKADFRGLARSLIERKSKNNLVQKFNFAVLCCPKRYLLFFVISDFFKVIARSTLQVLIGHRVTQLRSIVNRCVSRDCPREPDRGR